MPSPITTHVLDTSRGCPAAGIEVELFQHNGEQSHRIGHARTDDDGRIMNGLVEQDQLVSGTYRIRFQTQDYFQRSGTTSFYPEVSITFVVTNEDEHYHVPLLLSPFGFSTYRGS